MIAIATILLNVVSAGPVFLVVVFIHTESYLRARFRSGWCGVKSGCGQRLRSVPGQEDEVRR